MFCGLLDRSALESRGRFGGVRHPALERDARGPVAERGKHGLTRQQFRFPRISYLSHVLKCDRLYRFASLRSVRASTAIILPVSSGCLLAFAFPPFGWRDIVWVGLLPFAAGVAIRDRVECYLGAYLGGLTFYLVGLAWMRGVYGAVGLTSPASIAWLATAQVMAPGWLAAMGLARLLYHRLGTSMGVALLYGWAANLYTAEAISLLSTGNEWPWLELAAVQTHHDYLIQSADLGGAALLSLLIAYANGFLWDAINRRAGRLSVLITGALTILIVLYGSWRLSALAASTSVNVCLMGRQPSEALPDLSRRVDLLVWAEQAIECDRTSEDKVVRELQQYARQCGCALLAGCRRDYGEYEFNSLLFVDSQGQASSFYDKHCLAPWIEKIPRFAIPFVPERRPRLLCESGLPTFQVGHCLIAPAICLDACSTSLLRSYSDCNLIIASGSETADDTGVLSESMLQIAQLRAIELRRTIVRNVRDGYSGAITFKGRLLDVARQTERQRSATLVEAVPVADVKSAYASTGVWALHILLAAGAVLGLTVSNRLTRKEGWRRQ
jgi:apolipoprotein N-acyltransferase